MNHESDNQTQSDAIRRIQTQSDVISRNQSQSVAISRNQAQSGAIRRNQAHCTIKKAPPFTRRTLRPGSIPGRRSMRTLCTYPSRPRGLARSRRTLTIGGLLVTVCHSGKTRAGSSWLIRSSQNILNCAVNHVGPRRSSPDQWCAWRARCVWARASACARVRRGHARRDRAGLPRSARGGVLASSGWEI